MYTSLRDGQLTTLRAILIRSLRQGPPVVTYDCADGQLDGELLDGALPDGAALLVGHPVKVCLAGEHPALAGMTADGKLAGPVVNLGANGFPAVSLSSGPDADGIAQYWVAAAADWADVEYASMTSIPTVIAEYGPNVARMAGLVFGGCQMIEMTEPDNRDGRWVSLAMDAYAPKPQPQEEP